jgi:hypothetical protein
VTDRTSCVRLAPIGRGSGGIDPPSQVWESNKSLQLAAWVVISQEVVSSRQEQVLEV